MVTNNRMIKTCTFYLVPAMKTDRKRQGTTPLILNVGNCDTMAVSGRNGKIQKEDSLRTLCTAKMRVRRHSFKLQKSRKRNCTWDRIQALGLPNKHIRTVFAIVIESISRFPYCILFQEHLYCNHISMTTLQCLILRIHD